LAPSRLSCRSAHGVPPYFFPSEKQSAMTIEPVAPPAGLRALRDRMSEHREQDERCLLGTWRAIVRSHVLLATPVHGSGEIAPGKVSASPLSESDVSGSGC
jgi:hypothetical protein